MWCEWPVAESCEPVGERRQRAGRHGREEGGCGVSGQGLRGVAGRREQGRGPGGLFVKRGGVV